MNVKVPVWGATAAGAALGALGGPAGLVLGASVGAVFDLYRHHKQAPPSTTALPPPAAPAPKGKIAIVPIHMHGEDGGSVIAGDIGCPAPAHSLKG